MNIPATTPVAGAGLVRHPPPTPSGIYVIDDHLAIAQALVLVLELEGLGPAWAAEILTTRHVIDVAIARRPRLALVDVHLGEGANGLGLITPLRAVGTRVALWTARATPATVSSARRAGAETVWDKSMGLHELTDRIRQALAGDRLDPGLDRAGPPAPDGQADLERLSRREQEVLAGLVAGLAPKEIAADLGVAVPTVRTQIRQLFAKLGVNSQRAAVAVALRAGFGNPG